MKQRSILSLSLILIMVVINFFNIYYLVEEQKEVGKFINLSGKLRMLSQRTILLAERVEEKHDPATALKLKKAIAQMRDNAAFIEKESRGAVRHLFEGRNYRLAFYMESFLSKADDVLTGNNPKESLAYLRSLGDYILKTSDTVVAVFEQQHADYIQKVRLTAAAILGASILLIFLIYSFILRPALNTNEKLIGEIKDSEAKMKGITENTENIIFIKDLKGRYLFINRRFEKAFNTTNLAIRGLNDHEFFSPEEADLFIKNDRTVAQTLKKISTQEFAYQNGIRHYYLVDRFPVYKGDGTVYGVGGVATDITEITTLQKTMKEYVKLVDENIITSQTDMSGKITYVSEAFCRISGFSREELMGQTHRIVRHDDMPSSLYEDLWKTVTQGKTWRGEIKNKTKNGGFYWVDATIYPNFDDQGKTIIGYTAIRQDITDKKKIEEMSVTDELTKLFNRRFFNRTFEAEFNRCKRDGKRFTYLIMDVDNFKKYNDTYGHQLGDHVLTAIGEVLRHHTQRAGDFAFRLGGEEFGALLNCASEEEACNNADAIRQAILDLSIAHTRNPPYDNITVSVGVKSLLPLHSAEQTTDMVYKDADELLYLAKENGRNRIETCEPKEKL